MPRVGLRRKKQRKEVLCLTRYSYVFKAHATYAVISADDFLL